VHKIRLIQKSNCCQILLHPDIENILFRHRKQISLQMSNIIGIHHIDYVSYSIITPHNQLVIFSSTPSVEHNLIHLNLLCMDNMYNPVLYTDSRLCWWNEEYTPSVAASLRKVKEIDHGYTHGFGFGRHIQDVKMTYSFATRADISDAKLFYLRHHADLIKLGDYGLKQLAQITGQYLSPEAEVSNRRHLSLIKS